MFLLRRIFYHSNILCFKNMYFFSPFFSELMYFCFLWFMLTLYIASPFTFSFINFHPFTSNLTISSFLFSELCVIFLLSIFLAEKFNSFDIMNENEMKIMKNNNLLTFIFISIILLCSFSISWLSCCFFIKLFICFVSYCIFFPTCWEDIDYVYFFLGWHLKFYYIYVNKVQMLFQTMQELKNIWYPDNLPPDYLLFLSIILDMSIIIILYSFFRFTFMFFSFFFFFPFSFHILDILYWTVSLFQEIWKQISYK